MSNFNYYKYETLGDNQVLKIKLKDTEDWIFVASVTRRVLQAYQPAHTPITKINLKVIKNLELYKQSKDEDYDNHYELGVEPEEIEQFELLNINFTQI